VSPNYVSKPGTLTNPSFEKANHVWVYVGTVEVVKISL